VVVQNSEGGGGGTSWLRHVFDYGGEGGIVIYNANGNKEAGGARCGGTGCRMNSEL